MKDKSLLRQHYKRKRALISDIEKKQAAIAAAETFKSLPMFDSSKCIACYLPSKDEFDCYEIIHAIWQAKKHCYLPVISENKLNKQLKFYEYFPSTSLKLNRFNILEPDTSEACKDTREIDIMILPLLAFDLQGYRLGSGGGYYDATLNELTLAERKNIYLLGLGFAMQQESEISKDSWDIPMDAVLTEKQYKVFSNK